MFGGCGFSVVEVVVVVVVVVVVLVVLVEVSGDGVGVTGVSLPSEPDLKINIAIIIRIITVSMPPNNTLRLLSSSIRHL